MGQLIQSHLIGQALRSVSSLDRLEWAQEEMLIDAASCAAQSTNLLTRSVGRPVH
jgi:hypothetical protein